ncbi:MAG: EamA family transporter [Rhodospirillales bacterium]|nr:EamA family transporter [Rhodospirillales bacterium]
MRTGHAALLLVLVVVLWGVNWPMIKLGLQAMPPLWFAVARVFIGGATIAAIMLASGRLRLPARGDVPVILSVGVLQIGFFLATTHVALLFVEAGRSAILAYTTPLWVVPLSALLLGERIGAAQIGALVLGLAGLAVLFNPLAIDYGNADVLLGNGLLLAGAALWAITIIHVRAHHWHGTPLDLMTWQMALGVVALVPVALIVEPHPFVHWSWAFAAILFYNGPIASAFCFWAFVTVNRSLPAATTALGSLGVPVVGVLSAALVVGEPLTAATLTGLGLIGAGVAVLALNRRDEG